MTNLDPLLQSVAREEDALCVRTQVRQRARERLFGKPSGRRGAKPIGIIVPLTVAAAVAVAVGAHHWRRASAETRLVARDLNGILVEGSWVSALHGEEHPLRFSDGSTIALSSLSQARLVHLRPTGADVFLEAGLATVAVVHRPNAQWQITAGPFVVDVTGTRFEVSWSPVQDRFELELTEGSVVVTGCGFGRGQAVFAGQNVIGSCKTGRADVTPISDKATARNDVNAVTASAEPSTHRNCDDPLSEPASKARAEAKGGPNAQHATARELLDLGTLVRQEGDLARAKSIFVTLRRRFPGSKEAAQAAFAVGLVDFDGFGAYASAATWFRTYLAEQPSGALAREARGRLMEALYRSSSPDAKAAAEAYLAQNPAGPHAELARRILDQQ